MCRRQKCNLNKTSLINCTEPPYKLGAAFSYLERKNMAFSILPPSDVFSIYFALLKLTTRALHLRCGGPLHQSKSGFCERIIPFSVGLQSERSTSLLGSFRLVSQSRFRLLFHSKTLLFDRKNVLVHQMIDKQANVIYTAPMFYVT